MRTDRFVGLFPYPATLEQLGLGIPRDACQDATRFWEGARAILKDWTDKLTRELQRVDDLAKCCAAPPVEWRASVEGLTRERHRAGLRLWLGQTFMADVTVNTFSQLRDWSLLQQRALVVIEKAYPVAFCSGPSGRLDDGERCLQIGQLLDELEQLSKDPSTFKKRVWNWSCVSPNSDAPWDRMLYDHELEELDPWDDSALRFPPKPRDYQVLVRLAWQHAREVGASIAAWPPDMPTEVGDVNACTQALDSLVKWSLDQEASHSERGQQSHPAPAPVDEAATEQPSPARVGGDEPLGGAVKGEDSKKKRGPIPKDEANEQVRDYLSRNPKATARQVAAAVGISLGSLAKLSAWRARMDKRKSEAQGRKEIKTRPFTKGMQESLGKKDDPLSNLAAKEEMAWRHLMEVATPAERARLQNLSPKEKDAQVQLVLDQWAEQAKDAESADPLVHPTPP
jgi:hypothetical protein